MATVFLDSDVFMQGISSRWGAAKAVLILGASGVFSVHTSEIVIFEVQAALNRKSIPTGEGNDFERLIKELKLAVHPRPSRDAVQDGIRKYLPMIRHLADVPIIVTAVEIRSDWLVSSNSEHFNAAIARSTGLRIVTPQQLLRYLRITKEL